MRNGITLILPSHNNENKKYSVFTTTTLIVEQIENYITRITQYRLGIIMNI